MRVRQVRRDLPYSLLPNVLPPLLSSLSLPPYPSSYLIPSLSPPLLSSLLCPFSTGEEYGKTFCSSQLWKRMVMESSSARVVFELSVLWPVSLLAPA